MKWLGLAITLAAILPLSSWLRRNPRHTPKFWMLVGFLPFFVTSYHLFMAMIAWSQWQGFVSGFEFSVLDALVLALYLNLPRASNLLPFRLSMMLYFLAILLAVFQARVPTAALFYSWQLLRVFLVYTVVSRGVGADSRIAFAILKGMGAGLIIEAGFAIWQRFGLGMLQVDGTLGTQNGLGLISHFVVFPFFALLLTRSGGSLPVIVTLAGVIVEALTTSRATVSIAALGFAMVLALSAARQLTSRKMVIALGGLMIIAALLPLLQSSFGERGTAGSDLARESFLRVAAMMLSDHPWGIGPNQYLTIANIDGYDDAAGVLPNNRTSIVHNTYWLTVVETGYVGLFTFVILLLRPLGVAFLCAWRYRKDERSNLLLGLGVALLAVELHCFFEWIFVDVEIQYMFAIEVGLVAGLAQQLGYWGRSLIMANRGPVRTMSQSRNRALFVQSRRVVKRV